MNIIMSKLMNIIMSKLVIIQMTKRMIIKLPDTLSYSRCQSTLCTWQQDWCVYRMQCVRGARSLVCRH